jgi:hypothetical protein
VEAIMAFASANWPYFAAIVLLLVAWVMWEYKRAPYLPWHD